MRNLERENVSVRGELECFKMQVGQLESKLHMNEAKFSELQNRYENLDKQNVQLLNMGD